jgi:hypothetical protein
MKCSKIFVGLCAIGLVLFGMIGSASAARVSPPAQLYVVDTDEIGSVGLLNFNFQLDDSRILEMYYDGSWHQLDRIINHDTLTIFDSNHLQPVGFQIVDSSNDVICDNARLGFIGNAINYNGIDVYPGVGIYWPGEGLAVSIANISNGGFAAVPIPASVLLLGSGIIGLVAFRKRIGDS